MLKWALIFAALAVALGILGFIVHVAVAITKALFFLCLAGFVISFLTHLGRGRSS